ncbi:MAG: DNA primase [Patescibacteria group bacterium]|jgi:DNA primase|nr:DNA primase [Patescibacteria group bacterium]
MSNQVEEIKVRLDIVDLISEYIRLKPAGPNNWKALCPFHNEKSPSFMVSKDKQIWHCFGCGEGGDIFSFVQKMEGIEFVEALRLLAQKAGVRLVEQDPKLASQRNLLLDITQLAAQHWHQLLKTKQGTKAQDYLRQRQIKDEMIDEFRIGYAPDSWDSTAKYLSSKGFKDKDIFLAGLSVKKERGEGFYDRFRHRITFPIFDLHGNPVGFSARTLNPEEKGAKYINTPQTLIYNKSLVIFNLDKAKQEIKRQDLAILVEGQMDALAAYQAGTKNVIATSGTALTIEQIQILKRYTKNLAMAFDADSAGQSAAKRGIELALNQELNVKVIVLPSGKDPDECIRTNLQGWFTAVKESKSIMEYYFDQTFDNLDLTNVENKKKAAKVLLPVINKIADKVEQTHWLQKLANLINVSETILRESFLPSRQTVKTAAAPGVKNLSAQPSRLVRQLETILGLALKYPGNLRPVIDELPLEMMVEGDLQTLYKKLILYYTEDIKSNFKDFVYQDFSAKLNNDNLVALADRLVLLVEKDFFDFDPDSIRSELLKIIKMAKKDYYWAERKALEGKIKQAEAQGLDDQVKLLSEKLSQTLSNLNLLK